MISVTTHTFIFPSAHSRWDLGGLAAVGRSAVIPLMTRRRRLGGSRLEALFSGLSTRLDPHADGDRRRASERGVSCLVLPPITTPGCVQDVCPAEEAHLLGLLGQLQRNRSAPVQLQAGSADAAAGQRLLPRRPARGGELRPRQSLRPQRRGRLQEGLPPGGEWARVRGRSLERRSLLALAPAGLPVAPAAFKGCWEIGAFSHLFLWCVTQSLLARFLFLPNVPALEPVWNLVFV